MDSTEQNPSLTYQYAGTHTVSLTVTGLGGTDTETKTDYITVEQEREKDKSKGGLFDCGTCASMAGDVSVNELAIGWGITGLVWGGGYSLVRRRGRRRRR